MDKDSINKQDKFKMWFKQKDNLLLAGLIVFTVLLRIYYFLKVGEQPIWWDEGDYLAIAKVWATGMDTPEWWSHFTGMRPLLLPLIWTLFFKVGLGEMSLRFFTLLLPSIASVYLVYLLGRDLYSKKTGLIAGLMFSVFWVFSFYSFRLLTDIPAVFFGLLCFYFFWGKYIKENKPSGLYLSMLFGVIAFSIRFPYALVPVTNALFLIFTRRLSVFRDKTIWKGVGLTILFLLPYLIYLSFNNFAPLQFYFGDKAVSIKEPIGWYVIPLLLSLPHSIWIFAFFLGLLSLYPLILSTDLIWKQKTKEFNPDILLILWIFIHLIFYVAIIRGATDRWLLMLLPAMFILSGKGIEWGANFISKYNKSISLIFIVIILAGGFYQNISHGDSLINLKKDTYKEVKLAGEWLKENTLPDSKIVTASIVQNQYYSERQSYDYNKDNDFLFNMGCIDLYGATSTNSTCQLASESLFNQKVAEINPDYFIASVFEPVFTPQWVYSYGERNNLTPVQGYLDSNGNPLLIIYKF